MKKHKNFIIPYFVTMQGCRNRCIYCNQALLKEHGEKVSLNDVINQYTLYLSCADKREKELAFFGGTFLNLSENKKKELLEEARLLKTENKISRVRISTTPDSINKKNCEEIKDIVDIVELGVQVLNDNILRLLGRNYDVKTVISATSMLKNLGFKVCHQIMVGLPFETFNSFAKTVTDLCVLKPDFVRIYPLIVFKNTLLSNYFLFQLFKMPPMEEVVKRIAFAIQTFEKYDIRVIRVGLEAFCNQNDVVFSYSEYDWRGAAYTFLFGELVKQKVIGQKLKSLTILCSNRNQQYLSRFYKLNKSFFKDICVEKVTFKSWDVKRDLIDNAIYIEELGIETSLSDINWSLVDINCAF